MPNTVFNMRSTFERCAELQRISNIPNSVEIFRYTFAACSNLKEINIVIPESVKCMQSAFINDFNLYGKIVINASVTGDIYNNEEANITDGRIDYDSCFLNTSTTTQKPLVISGKCSVLEDIFATRSENSNIVLEK